MIRSVKDPLPVAPDDPECYAYSYLGGEGSEYYKLLEQVLL